MRTYALIVLMVTMSSCAHSMSRWDWIKHGQTRAEAIDMIGEPHGTAKYKDQTVLTWRKSNGKSCALFIDKGNRIDRKMCSDEPAEKWAAIEPGLSRDDVMFVMGQPLEFTRTEDGSEALSWLMDRFTKCGVKFDKSARVAEKRCIEDQQARAQAEANQAAMWMNYSNQMHQRQMQQEQNNQNNMQMFQQRRPSNTSCTSRTVGGQVYTDCSSR